VTPPGRYDDPVATAVRRAVALLAGAEDVSPRPVVVAASEPPAAVPRPRVPTQEGLDLPSIYRELASLARDVPAAPRERIA